MHLLHGDRCQVVSEIDLSQAEGLVGPGLFLFCFCYIASGGVYPH